MSQFRSIAASVLGTLKRDTPVAGVGTDGARESEGLEAPLAGAANIVRHNGRVYRLGFVLGVGKSGTNWVGNLLNRHPRILCEGEFNFQVFFDAHRRFTGAEWQAGHRPNVRDATRPALEELVRRGMAAVAGAKPRADWIVDRSPRWFEVYLEGAPHVYIMRDGRDVLVSHTFHHLRVNEPDHIASHLREVFGRHAAAFAADAEAVTPKNPGLLDDEQWVRHHARRWGEQVQHDLERIRNIESCERPAPVLTVRYEDLHADTELWRRRIYEHFGVHPEEARGITERSHTAAGFGREDRASFFRKGEVGDWRNYASERFCRWFREEAGEALIEAGYERESNWEVPAG